MVVFNTFTNGKRYSDIPETDILIWAAALVRYKSFGYTTKLYCLEEDFDFLRRYHLLELYDEIDTTLLKDNAQLSLIDESIFWSSRKIEAMYHELFDLNRNSIYADTDILMNQPFEIAHDVLVWSPEPRVTDGNSIYVPWRYLSKPYGYQMPQYILDCKDAFNCGIWYFKNKEVFAEYRNAYYAFCIGNPGKTKHADNLRLNNAIFPCNAEQRILKAVLLYYNQDVAFVMPEKKKGLSTVGKHYFWYRVSWREMKKANRVPLEESLFVLNHTLLECLGALKTYKNSTLYDFYANLPWLKGFEAQFTDKYTYPIKEYN